MRRGGLVRAACAVAFAPLLAACPGGATGTRLATAREVRLDLVLRDVLSFRGVAPNKELHLVVAGAPRPAGDGADVVVAAVVETADVSYADADGAVTHAGTSAPPPHSATASALDLARTALLEGCRGAPVELTFRPDPERPEGFEELASVRGLAAALRAARDRVRSTADVRARGALDEAAGGLEAWFDDAATTRALRAAGLGPAEADALRGRGVVERTADVAVDGVGLVRVALRGEAGFASEGSPTVRLRGTADAAATPLEPSRVEPPPELGAVRLGDVTVEAETQYRRDDGRPLRGNVRVELPHTGGPLARRAVEFVLLVRP